MERQRAASIGGLGGWPDWQTAAWILRAGQLLDSEASGISPALLRSQTDVGVVDHLGPCVAVDGLDVGWRRPTAPLGSGALTWGEPP